MNEEKDFFKTCFDTVAGLNVENESQAIAKEVVLSEIENLQQIIDKAIEYINKNSIHFATKDKVGNYFYNCKTDELLEILKGKDE